MCPPTSVVVDALDECSDRGEFLHALQPIINNRHKVRFFLTSRKEYGIEQSLASLPQIILNGDSLSLDIDMFVESQLRSLVS